MIKAGKNGSPFDQSYNPQKSGKTQFSDDAAQNLGAGYQKLAQNNPFDSYEYQDTFWDKVGDTFGFNTTQDKLRMQYQQDSKNYLAQLLQTQREEQYNSPLSQVQRLRQAGLNPDLSGGVSAGEASEFDNQALGNVDLSQVGTSVGDVVSGIGAIASGITGFIDMSFAVATLGTKIMKQRVDLMSATRESDGKLLDNQAKTFGVSRDKLDLAYSVATRLSESQYSGKEIDESLVQQFVHTEDAAGLVPVVQALVGSDEFRNRNQRLRTEMQEQFNLERQLSIGRGLISFDSNNEDAIAAANAELKSYADAEFNAAILRFQLESAQAVEGTAEANAGASIAKSIETHNADVRKKIEAIRNSALPYSLKWSAFQALRRSYVNPSTNTSNIQELGDKAGLAGAAAAAAKAFK